MKKIFIKLKNFLFHVLAYDLVTKITCILPNLHHSNLIRGYLIGFFLKKRGKKFMLASGCTINMARNLEVGDNVYIAHDCWINATGGLKIEDGVIISPKVVIATTKHAYINGSISLKSSINAPIVIKKGTWVASNTVITLGTTIGEGVIIGAGSVVTKNINSFYFAAGIPAKEIRFINNKSTAPHHLQETSIN